MTKRYVTMIRREHREVPMEVPICSKCGGENDRAPQRYCKKCNAAAQRAFKRGRVMIPESMLTSEQRAFLDRSRPGRRRVSHEINVSNKTSGGKA